MRVVRGWYLNSMGLAHNQYENEILYSLDWDYEEFSKTLA